LLRPAQDYVAHRGFSHERLDGGVTGERRQAAIDRFCAPGSNTFLFLLGTKAGGVGINLTAADTVILFDPDWNPQNDVQAQARCHRIGQTKPVRVYRLVTRDTYEDQLYRSANKKLGLEQAIIGRANYHAEQGGDEAAASAPGGKLDATEIEALLKHGAQRLFSEEHDEKIASFNAASIESILQTHATTTTTADADHRNGGGGGGGEASVFASATFVAHDGDAALDLHDPHFWSKVLGEDAEADLGGEDDEFADEEDTYRMTESGGVSRYSRRAAGPPRRLSANVLPPPPEEDASKAAQAGPPWTKAQLSAVLSGLHTLGYGRPAELRAAASATLGGRDDAEVAAVVDVAVMVALACVREQAWTSAPSPRQAPANVAPPPPPVLAHRRSRTALSTPRAPPPSGRPRGTGCGTFCSAERRLQRVPRPRPPPSLQCASPPLSRAGSPPASPRGQRTCSPPCSTCAGCAPRSRRPGWGECRQPKVVE